MFMLYPAINELEKHNLTQLIYDNYIKNLRKSYRRRPY